MIFIIAQSLPKFIFLKDTVRLLAFHPFKLCSLGLSSLHLRHDRQTRFIAHGHCCTVVRLDARIDGSSSELLVNHAVTKSHR